MTCAKCGKEILLKEQQYLELGTGRIPLPCAECIEKMKREIEEHPDKWRERNKKK